MFNTLCVKIQTCNHESNLLMLFTVLAEVLKKLCLALLSIQLSLNRAKYLLCSICTHISIIMAMTTPNPDT